MPGASPGSRSWRPVLTVDPDYTSILAVNQPAASVAGLNPECESVVPIPIVSPGSYSLLLNPDVNSGCQS